MTEIEKEAVEVEIAQAVYKATVAERGRCLAALNRARDGLKPPVPISVVTFHIMASGIIRGLFK